VHNLLKSKSILRTMREWCAGTGGYLIWLLNLSVWQYLTIPNYFLLKERAEFNLQ